jgi:hypothetical protein
MTKTQIRMKYRVQENKKSPCVGLIFLFSMCFILANTTFNSEVTQVIFNYMFQKLFVLQQ